MELPTVQATVTLPRDWRGRIGLTRKKQAIHHDNGEIGYSLGLYNGWGGKREPEDETIHHTAKRETEDEGGVVIDVRHLKLLARVYFYVPDGNGGHAPFMDVSFFFLRKWKGTFRESGEMGPIEWFSKRKMPFHDMMPADGEIFGRIFAGERAVYEVKLNGKKAPFQIRKLEDFPRIPWHIDLYVRLLTAWKRL